MIGRNLFNIYGTNNSFKSFLDTLLLPVKTGMKLCALVWMCHHCILDVCADANNIATLLQPLALTCEACGTTKHKETANFKIWSCKFCTLDNSVNLERCLACGEWRYSYGPPTSARGPYVGT